MATVHGSGRLTPNDHKEIERLASSGLKSGAIAKKLRRHPSTVNWYMYSAGLQAPKPAPEKQLSYLRHGRRVHRYTAEEDAFIEALRVQDFSFQKIAEAATQRFSTDRTAHTIQMRLIMLSARESVDA